jgi:lipid-A-disaccharide synthase
VSGPIRIAMVAGEASGDQLGAYLIQALKQALPDVRFYGIGGPKMIAEGFDALYPAERLAVRGYAEVLRHYWGIARIRRELRRRLLDDRPQAFVGIDAPDFNLGLERRLKARGIPTVHYVSPSIWAWRGGRIRKIGRAVSHMLALFPFEPGLYQARGIPVTYVGHPLADAFPLEVDVAAARERVGVPPEQPIFALLPGSRQSEVEYMAETFVETARLLHQRFPQAQFLVPFATRETRALFETALYKLKAEELPIKLLFGHAHDAMAAANGVLVASGTATLEAALLKKPMVIAYRISKWTFRLVRRMVHLPYAGLPNILAGRFVVPEFIQDDATPENLAQALGNLVTDRVACERLVEIFNEIHLTLRQDTARKAAGAMLPYLARLPAWMPTRDQPA